ncbi:DUF1330 domain-containing protein [Rhodovulum sp. YNF3179]|uniref:DUF1330 domain-containing protein n=1 Tax=Rhodovulum sp. YNF3179 TaxID=3425127 RepID=UPI003D346EF0
MNSLGCSGFPAVWVVHAQSPRDASFQLPPSLQQGHQSLAANRHSVAEPWSLWFGALHTAHLILRELLATSKAETEILEGGWVKPKTVLMRFRSVQDAKAWHADPEYVELTKIRHRTARTNLVVVDGILRGGGGEPSLAKEAQSTGHEKAEDDFF